MQKKKTRKEISLLKFQKIADKELEKTSQEIVKEISLGKKTSEKDKKQEIKIEEVIVVDGSNVAWTDIDKKDRKPSAKNIQKIVNCLKEKGFKEIVVIVSASLRHYVKDVEIFNQLKKEGILKEAPAKSDNDLFIIKYAIEKNAYIITNDTFRNYLEKYPNLDKIRIPFMIINETITFDEKLDRLR